MKTSPQSTWDILKSYQRTKQIKSSVVISLVRACCLYRKKIATLSLMWWITKWQSKKSNSKSLDYTSRDSKIRNFRPLIMSVQCHLWGNLFPHGRSIETWDVECSNFCQYRLAYDWTFSPTMSSRVHNRKGRNKIVHFGEKSRDLAKRVILIKWKNEMMRWSRRIDDLNLYKFGKNLKVTSKCSSDQIEW